MDTDTQPRNTWELFQQIIWWKDVTGTWHELATMDPRHRDNLLPFLRRRARNYRDAAHHAATTTFYDAPDDVFESAMEPFEIYTDEQWLESTPLVRELQRYESERSTVGRWRTWSHNRTYKLRKRLGLARS